MKDMRMSMARSVMRLGPVHVVVVAPSAQLRTALVSWLRTNKRVKLVRQAATAADLGTHRIDCDLVVASALEGTRDLRALSRRFGSSAGLVALSLGTTPLPAGWAPLHPGAAHDHVLDHAMPHPERSIAATSTALASILVAFIAVVLSVAWVPETSVSFQRAALAYAARFPDTSTWWHIWGAGGPFLAAASWPLLKAAALTGGGPEVFVLLAGIVGAAFGVSFLFLALRAGARGYAVIVALAAIVPPALWVWPRGGDVASLAGLTGVVLALAVMQVGRLRILTVALAVAVSAFGGYLWVLAAAIAAAIPGVRARRARASIAGALFGILMATAIAAPPILYRGLEGLRPTLARTPAVSDLVPVVASAALIAMVLARGRMRRATIAAAALAVVAANVLAFAVPVQELSVARIASTGPHGRLAVHPAEALALAARFPDLPTTGDMVPVPLILGNEPKERTNVRLEWLGADRAMLPDRTSAVIFNERDWSLIDRDRLIFGAPSVRPVLTAGITPTLLLVADEADARVFGDALIALGATSERAIAVRAMKQLDELDFETLRDFTLLAIYGRPWNDAGKAQTVLEQFLQRTGLVFWDNAARAGDQPLVGTATTIRADDATVAGDEKLVASGGYGGRVTAIDRFAYGGDQTWEQAAIVVGNKRVVQLGQGAVLGDVGSVAAHLAWSGADLPARAAGGDEHAVAQLRGSLQWLLGAAQAQAATGFGRPGGGDSLENDFATVRFIDPARWRVDIKAASTGILFKERYHEQWRASAVDITPLSGLESKTTLKIRPTANGFMYVVLPPNARRVDLVFERHPFESAARGVSGVAAFVTIAITFFLLRRR
jgi:hypothetical protein